MSFLGGKPKCYTICSQYTKEAKRLKNERKKGREVEMTSKNEGSRDDCSSQNSACEEGTWLGMFKCRNKFAPKTLSPAVDQESL